MPRCHNFPWLASLQTGPSREDTQAMHVQLETRDAADTFEVHRPRLFGIAYRMLGSVQDAEDVVQDVYLRWHQASTDQVLAPEGWLVTVATRLSIDRLRRAAVERERYSGDWLPEPIATSSLSAADRGAELASDLSMAFLVMLERLAPLERAALVLRDVFDTSYADMARTLEKSEVATRQLVHRARVRVRNERVRQTVSAEATGQLLERFLDALHNYDQDALLAVVAEDASWVSDGGGKVPAARRVLHGADRILRFVQGLERKYREMRSYRVVEVNEAPAIAWYAGDQLISVTAVQSDGKRLQTFYNVLNPDKLRHLQQDLSPVATA